MNRFLIVTAAVAAMVCWPLSHLRADSLMKNGHIVVIGWGEKSGTLIKWTDCEHKKSAQYEAPPYWVDKNDNCKLRAQAFGIEERGGKYVVADAKEFRKYFPAARKGQEVSFVVIEKGVELAVGGSTLRLMSDIAPTGDYSPERTYEVAEGSDVAKRIDASARVLDEIMATQDRAIPDKVMHEAKCIVVIPSMVKAAVGFGGGEGKGVATCRTDHGSWSAPAPITITVGGWGLLLGAQAIDLVLIVTNDQGREHLLAGKFVLGGDATSAAGPVGRDAWENTDWKMKAEVLSYSRSRGLFAGMDLSGAVIAQDRNETELLYGKKVPLGAVLGGRVTAPAGSRPFLGAVRKYTEAGKGSG